jgi:signal transduction histidine kinase
MSLRLFICRAIAEQHGGQISVTSRIGQGSTFEVALPLMQEEEQYADAKADDPGRG